MKRCGTYTHVRYEDGITGEVDESVTRYIWDADMIAAVALDGSKVTVRPATEDEIRCFIESGKQDEEDDFDREFDRGWNEAKASREN